MGAFSQAKTVPKVGNSPNNLLRIISPTISFQFGWPLTQQPRRSKNPPILWILLVSTTTRLLMQTILLSQTRMNTMLMPALTQVHLDYRLQNYDQDERFLSPMRHLNTVCFQGHQLTYDTEKKTYSRITVNTGHWGPNVYPGCRQVRNGENAFLKDMEYEKYTVGRALN